MRIGIHDFERAAPQRILFDIDLYVPLHQNTPRRDQIDEVVNYDFVRSEVTRITERGHIDLQETLCDAVLDALLAHPQVVAVRVHAQARRIMTTATPWASRPTRPSPPFHRPHPHHDPPASGHQTLLAHRFAFQRQRGHPGARKECTPAHPGGRRTEPGRTAPAPRDDDILHVLDYRRVRQIIIDECTAEHVNLLETLIGKLAPAHATARRAGRTRENCQTRNLW